jgi:hypothetical protein
MVHWSSILGRAAVPAFHIFFTRMTINLSDFYLTNPDVRRSHCWSPYPVFAALSDRWSQWRTGVLGAYRENNFRGPPFGRVVQVQLGLLVNANGSLCLFRLYIHSNRCRCYEIYRRNRHTATRGYESIFKIYAYDNRQQYAMRALYAF